MIEGLLSSITCACVPGVMARLTLNLRGKERISLTEMDKPISVAIEQCGIVGVKVTFISFSSSFTVISSSYKTPFIPATKKSLPGQRRALQGTLDARDLWFPESSQRLLARPKDRLHLHPSPKLFALWVLLFEKESESRFEALDLSTQIPFYQNSIKKAAVSKVLRIKQKQWTILPSLQIWTLVLSAL